jgi:hypothetical protein
LLEQTIMEDAAVSAIEMRSRPLCCRYFLVQFKQLAIQVEGERGLVHCQALAWAFGALDSRQHEVLGVWSAPASPESMCLAAIDDMRVRGVEEIRFVSSGEFAPLHAVVGKVFPGTTVLSEIARFDPYPVLPPHHRRTLRMSEAVVQRLDRCARRAVRRHGSFAGIGSAAAFVLEALSQDEQRITVAGGGFHQASERLAYASSRRSKHHATAA